MKINYNEKADSLSIIFKFNDKIVESDEAKSGIISDYNQADELVSIEILDASKHVSEVKKIEFQTV